MKVKRMTWFEEWLDERRKVRMKRIEVGSIPRVWLGTLAVLIALLAVAVVSAAYMVAHALDGMAQSSSATVTALGGVGEQVSKSVGEVIASTPEIALVGIGAATESSEDTTMKLAALGVLKQMSASGNADVQGHIAGHFVSEEVRRMEKVNLSCIDAYNYYELNTSKPSYPRDMEIAKDRGGSKYAEVNDTVFIKVPAHNCAMREYSTPTTADLVMDDFEVHRVTASASYSGLPR